MKLVRPTIRSAKGEAPATAPVVSPGHAVDVPYTLWLATVAGALMATVALAIVVALYLLDATLSLTGGAPAFGSDLYRAEEARVGTEGGRSVRSRWFPAQ